MKMYSLVLKIYIKIRKIKIKQDSNESNFITFLYAKSDYIATKFSHNIIANWSHIPRI